MRRRTDTIRRKLRSTRAKANLDVLKKGVDEAIARRDQQKEAVKSAQIAVKSSEMRANQQQAFLRGQSSQREKATQYSPLNGVVADIPTRVGEFAVSQLSSTPLMTIADMSTINIEVNVDETEIASVDVSQEAKVKVDALGEKEIKAVVTQKNPLAIAKSDTQGGLSNRVNVQEAKEFKVTLELRDITDEVKRKAPSGHERHRHHHHQDQEQRDCRAASGHCRKSAADAFAGPVTRQQRTDTVR